MVKLLKITRRGFLSAYCSLRTKWSETKRNVACVASVSVQLRSKERGTRVKDRAKNGVSERAGRGWERKEGKAFQRPPEVDFLHSWANFQADRLYKSNDTYQYKCGGVKVHIK